MIQTTQKIELDVIQVAPGTVCVLPEEHRVEASYKRMIVRRDDDTEETFAARVKSADTIREAALKLRSELAGKANKRVYEFRPYSAEDKLLAQAAATTYTGAQTPVWDGNKYQFELFKRCFVDPVGQMEPPVYNALVAEMMERTEPDPARLDFLSLWRASSGTTA